MVIDHRATGTSPPGNEDLREALVNLARARQRAEKRLRDHEYLLSALQLLNRSGSARQLFSQFLEILRNLFPFEEALILIEDLSGDLRPVVASSPRFQGVRWPAGSFFGRVLEGQTAVCYDIGLISEWKELPERVRRGVSSALHVPLRTERRRAVMICTHSVKGYFTPEHRRTLETAAPVVAQAIANAEARAQEQKRRALEREHQVVREKSRLLEQATGALGIGVGILRPGGSLESIGPTLDRMTAAWGGPKAWWAAAEPRVHLEDTVKVPPSGRATVKVQVPAPGGRVRVFQIALPGYGREIAAEAQAETLLVTDITVASQAEQELLTAKEQAEAANRAKDQFLATMSHEIRTPLNAILATTELMLEDAVSNEQVESLRTAQSNAQTLLHLITDLLDFARIEVGEMAVDLQPFDLPALVEEVSGLLSRRAKAKGLELVCDVDPTFPQSIQGDPLRMKQILINLAGNAVKFTDEGEVVVKLIGPSRDAARPEFTLSVTDTGIGISEEDQQRIFGRFVQADSSTTRRFGGTGLGLSICSSLARLLGGRIKVESQLGKGSTFTVVLPMADSLPPFSVSEQPLPGYRFLVAARSFALRRSLERYLENWGAEVVPILSGDRIAATLQERDALSSGLVLDACSLFHNGKPPTAETLEAIQASGLPVVVLGPCGREEIDLESILPEGHALTKPIRRRRLLGTLSSALGLSLAPDRAQATAAGGVSLAPGRILLAEDYVDNRRLLGRFLTGAGLTVEAVENGVEAVEAARTRNFDLILMDIEMPDADGFEATARIRAFEAAEGRSQTPIIALTAHAVAGFRDRCLLAGMDDYLAKPISKEQLLETTALWLDKRRDRRESVELDGGSIPEIHLDLDLDETVELPEPVFAEPLRSRQAAAAGEARAAPASGARALPPTADESGVIWITSAKDLPAHPPPSPRPGASASKPDSAPASPAAETEAARTSRETASPTETGAPGTVEPSPGRAAAEEFELSLDDLGPGQPGGAQPAPPAGDKVSEGKETTVKDPTEKSADPAQSATPAEGSTPGQDEVEAAASDEIWDLNLPEAPELLLLPELQSPGSGRPESPKASLPSAPRAPKAPSLGLKPTSQAREGAPPPPAQSGSQKSAEVTAKAPAAPQPESAAPSPTDADAAIWVRIDPEIADLVPVFLARCRKSVGQIESLLENAEVAEIRRMGHDFKGSGRAYGFVELSSLGLQLEDAATLADVRTIRRLRGQLEDYLTRVRYSTL